MGFQSTVSTLQGFDVPGEIFQDTPWIVQSWTLNSSGTPNIVGGTAYTITSQGFAQAGNGGIYGFAGILAIPKSYALFGTGQSPLAASLNLADFTQAELVTQGTMVVTLPSTANIGDYVIYDNTTGALSSMPPSDIVPSGFTFANAIVVLFTKSASGAGLAVIEINAAGVASAASGGHWPYVDTLWSASNGLDTNGGDSQDLPKLTPAGIHVALVATVPNKWNIVDVGIYNFAASFVAPCPLNIEAPGAEFTWSGGASVIFNQNTSSVHPLDINLGVLNAAGSTVVFQGQSPVYTSGPGGYLNIINAAGIWDDSSVTPVAHTAFNVNTDNAGGTFAFRSGSRQVINALNLGQSAVTSTTPTGAGTEITEVKAHFWDGSVGGTADYFVIAAKLGGDFDTTTTGVLNLLVGKSDFDAILVAPYNGLVLSNPVNVNGITSNVFGNPISMNFNSIDQSVLKTVFTSPASGAWTYTYGLYDCGGMIDGINIDGVVTLPAGSSVPYGWNVGYKQEIGPGGPQFVVQDSDTFAAQAGTPTSVYGGEGGLWITRLGSNGAGGFNYVVTGDVFNSGLAFAGQNTSSRVDSPLLTHTNLATAAHVTLFTATRVTSQYAISNIMLNGVGGTNFSGGGGDRNLAITDGTNVYTVIPAATLQALVNDVWNSSTTNVPLPVSIPLNQKTVAGATVYAAYSGGTTDYTAGSVSITLEYERVVF